MFLPKEIIFVTVAGSHLYGLNTPDSDIDLRGVCLDPIDSLFGLQGFEQYQPSKEQALEFSALYGMNSDDITIFGLRKFCRLLLDNNPNIVELLFASNLSAESSLSGMYTQYWESIVARKNLFLSSRIRHTFSGYAYSQLARIKGHKRWIDNPPTKPDPNDFGMELTAKGGQRWTDSNKYNQYQSLLKDYQSYETWQKERNPKRKELELKYGYDTKHAMHLFRLFLEAEELLKTGTLVLPLREPVRQMLLDIKSGSLEYREVLSRAETMLEHIKNMPTDLPDKPNRNKIQLLLIEIYTKMIKEVI